MAIAMQTPPFEVSALGAAADPAGNELAMPFLRPDNPDYWMVLLRRIASGAIDPAVLGPDTLRRLHLISPEVVSEYEVQPVENRVEKVLEQLYLRRLVLEKYAALETEREVEVSEEEADRLRHQAQQDAAALMAEQVVAAESAAGSAFQMPSLAEKLLYTLILNRRLMQKLFDMNPDWEAQGFVPEDALEGRDRVLNHASPELLQMEQAVSDSIEALHVARVQQVEAQQSGKGIEAADAAVVEAEEAYQAAYQRLQAMTHGGLVAVLYYSESEIAEQQAAEEQSAEDAIAQRKLVHRVKRKLNSNRVSSTPFAQLITTATGLLGVENGLGALVALPSAERQARLDQAEKLLKEKGPLSAGMQDAIGMMRALFRVLDDFSPGITPAPKPSVKKDRQDQDPSPTN